MQSKGPHLAKSWPNTILLSFQALPIINDCLSVELVSKSWVSVTHSWGNVGR
jgi:hypothetical protein